MIKFLNVFSWAILGISTILAFSLGMTLLPNNQHLDLKCKMPIKVDDSWDKVNLNNFIVPNNHLTMRIGHDMLPIAVNSKEADINININNN